MTKKKAPIDTTADRVRVAETLLIQRVRVSTVIAHLVRAYGVSERQAQRYVEKVRDGWRAGAPRDLETREQRRDEVRATIDEVIRLAMQARKPLRAPDGGPVLGQDGEPVTVAAPDLRAALHGLRLAIQLDALEAPTGRVVRSAPSSSGPAIEAEIEEPEAEGLTAVGEAEPDTVRTAEAATLAKRLQGHVRQLVAIPGGRSSDEG